MQIKKVNASSWQSFPFAECVSFQEGPGIRKNQHGDTGIPFINIRGIHDTQLIMAKMNRISFHTAESLYKRFLLNAGDIIVSGSGTLGKVAQVKPNDLPCLSNTGIIRMHTRNAARLDQTYLLYFLQSPLFQEQVKALAIGSAQKNFGPAHLKQMKIVIPPLSVQKDIASLLQNIDQLITSANVTNIHLHELNRTLFNQQFSALQGKKKPLREFCSLTLGGDWGKDTPQKSAIHAYCLRGIDLMHLHKGGYADAPLRWITPRSAQKRTVTECDIIIAASGAGACGQALWAGQAMIDLYDKPVIYSNFCKRLRTRHSFIALYISHILQAMYENGQMRHYINGTSVPNLDMHGLLNGKHVVMPAAAHLRSYAAQVTRHERLRYNQQPRQLQLLKQYLLNEMFSMRLGPFAENRSGDARKP